MRGHTFHQEYMYSEAWSAKLIA